MSRHADSIISLDDFEVLPDTPGSLRSCQVNMEDFEEPSPLSKVFCEQISADEYEEQCSTNTDRALKDLVTCLQKDPSVFFKVLQRRKLEELEHSGMVSFLKTKFLLKLQGEKFQRNLVTTEECDRHLNDVIQGMTKAHSYSQEIKGRKQYNTRLTAKRRLLQQQQQSNDENIASPHQQFVPNKCPLAPKLPRKCPPPPPPPPPSPPPPPPCPPLAVGRKVTAPLRDQTNIVRANDSLHRPPIKTSLQRTASTVSVASLHEELTSSNPLKRLRATHNRSPGGTPRNYKRQRRSTESLRFDTPAKLNSPNGEPLTTMLLRMMEQKFRHVRSPSPCTPSRGSISTSPETGFTP